MQNIKIMATEQSIGKSYTNTGESKKTKKKSNKKTKIPERECNICFNTLNKSTRSEVICLSCNYSCCKTCVRTYLMGTTSEAHCVNCKITWDREFSQNAMGRTFYNNDYKTHRKNLMFEIEKARFPETMPAVKSYIDVKELTEENIKIDMEREVLRRKLYELEGMLYSNRNKIRRLKNGESKENKVKFVKKCPADGCNGFLSTAWKCGVCKLWVCPHCEQEKGYEKDAPHECDPNILASIKSIKKETKQCPKCSVPIYKIDGCDQMWCTACQVAFSWRTGRVVNGVIHNPHFYEFQRTHGNNIIRNPGAVVCGGIPGYMTVRDRNRALVRIIDNLKYEKLGEVCQYIAILDNNFTKRNIYFPKRCLNLDEDITRNGKSIHDMALLITDRYEKALNQSISPMPNTVTKDFISQSFVRVLMGIHRKALHFQDVILNANREWCQRNRNNEDLRIQFLTKEISEEKMKSKLISRDKMLQKKKTALNVYEVFGTIITESVIDMYNYLTEKVEILSREFYIQKKNINIRYLFQLIDNYINNYQRMEEVRNYCNGELKKISKIYSQTVHLINRRFDIESYKFKKKNSKNQESKQTN